MIFTEDVEKIFGKRPWVSRTDEILAAKAVASNDGSGQTDVSDFVEVEATEVAADDTDKSDKHQRRYQRSLIKRIKRIRLPGSTDSGAVSAKT